MSNLFLNIKGIPGESQRKKDAIEVFSYTWGESNSSSPLVQGKGMAATTGHMGDVSFASSISKASPLLMIACATGEHIDDATLICRKAGDKSGDKDEYLKFVFSGVMVSSYNVSGSAGEVPSESFTLAFSKVEMEYKEQSEKGDLKSTVKKSWDLKVNKAT